jgi:hypothetical protein
MLVSDDGSCFTDARWSANPSLTASPQAVTERPSAGKRRAFYKACPSRRSQAQTIRRVLLPLQYAPYIPMPKSRGPTAWLVAECSLLQASGLVCLSDIWLSSLIPSADSPASMTLRGIPSNCGNLQSQTLHASLLNSSGLFPDRPTGSYSCPEGL